MSKVRFRREAEADLRAIVDWYRNTAPPAVSAILADIRRSLDLIERYPRAGMLVPGRSFRRIVTRRYRFKIAYQLDADEVIVIGLFRYQNRDA